MKNLILLLASDHAIGKAIGEALEARGYFVTTASDVSQAEQLLRQFDPDLLMVRHYTESLSGHDAATYLRTIRPGIPVLLVGGILAELSVETRELAKRFEIFPPPFQASELVAKVAEMLGDTGASAGTDHDLG